MSTHWECHIAPETRSALRHFRSGLAELAKSHSVIGHCHPRARGWAEPIFRGLGIEFVSSFDEVCRRADLYVCDNSSSMYEFAATGRPVVVLNAPWYRREVNFGLRFWDAARVGLQCDEPAQLVETVIAALEDTTPARSDREAAVAIAYAFRSGAAQRAADAIVKWLVMKAVILVPRRADHGHRDKVWDWCRAWWERELPELEIVEGHHDAGLFNRSAAVNRAAREAGAWDVAVIIDADVICDPGRVREAIEVAATEQNRLVLPFTRRHNLNPLGSAQDHGR